MYTLPSACISFVHLHLQIAETLEDIFRSEQRVLGTSATIDRSADSFPYDQILNWVRTCNLYLEFRIIEGSHPLYSVCCLLV